MPGQVWDQIGYVEGSRICPKHPWRNVYRRLRSDLIELLPVFRLFSTYKEAWDGSPLRFLCSRSERLRRQVPGAHALRRPPVCLRDAGVCRLPRQSEMKSGFGRFPWDFPARNSIRPHNNNEPERPVCRMPEHVTPGQIIQSRPGIYTTFSPASAGAL